MRISASAISSSAPTLGLPGHIAQDSRPPELAVHSGEHPVDVVGVGHVAGDRQRLAAELANAVRRGLDASRIAIEQHEVGAGLGQRDRHSAAHALRASGNDDRLVGQIEQVAMDLAGSHHCPERPGRK